MSRQEPGEPSLIVAILLNGVWNEDVWRALSDLFLLANENLRVMRAPGKGRTADGRLHVMPGLTTDLTCHMKVSLPLHRRCAVLD